MAKGIINLEKYGNITNSIVIIGSNNHIDFQNPDINYGIHKDLYSAEKVDLKLRHEKELAEICPGKVRAKNSLDRAVWIEEAMRKILLISAKNRFTPTLRLYGHFSPFSTVKGEQDHSDIDLLEKDEKKLMIEWAEAGYPVKVIVSLQVALICEMSYTIETYEERCKDFI